MENRLSRQLAAIKKRALARAQARESKAGSTDARTGGVDAHESERVVEDVVATGAVVRGANFDPLRSLRRRLPRWMRRTRQPQDSHDPLAQFKTGDRARLETLVAGEAMTADGVPLYLVRAVGPAVDRAAPEEATLFSQLRAWPQDVNCVLVGPRGGSRQPPVFSPRRTLFLDIETAGLSANTYLFLCGMMYFDDSGFVVEQAFARTYEEEGGVLRHVRNTMARFDTVVTYNGTTFDLPFIRTRMAIHRLPDVGVMGSVDLLHAARRVFRPLLPNCRLITVERHLRSVDRSGDIPGRYIPDAYHDYVATGDGRAMKPVLYHNLMDIFTMAVIVNRLAAKNDAPTGDFRQETLFFDTPGGLP